MTMSGVLQTGEGDWVFYGPSGESICVLPTEEDRQNDAAASLHNTVQTVNGRLMWSSSTAGWCIDANMGASPTLVNPETPVSLLAMLSAIQSAWWRTLMPPTPCRPMSSTQLNPASNKRKRISSIQQRILPAGPPLP